MAAHKTAGQTSRGTLAPRALGGRVLDRDGHRDVRGAAGARSRAHRQPAAGPHPCCSSRTASTSWRAWDLEELARERVHEFLFVALPVKIRGATGSMVDPVRHPLKESTSVTATMEALVVLEPKQARDPGRPDSRPPARTRCLPACVAVSICGDRRPPGARRLPGASGRRPSRSSRPRMGRRRIAALGPVRGSCTARKVGGPGHGHLPRCLRRSARSASEGPLTTCARQRARAGPPQAVRHSVQGADATYVVQRVKCIFPLAGRDLVRRGRGHLIPPPFALHVAKPREHRPGRQTWRSWRRRHSAS